MEKYYLLNYKSNPHEVAYILHQNRDKLEFLASSISPESRKISLDNEGNLIIPKYFVGAKLVDRLTALREVSKKKGNKIKEIVDKM